MVSVRRATLEDLDGIVSMLRRHILSCPNSFPAPERECVAQTILSSFHHTSPMAVFLSYEGSDITGISCSVSSRYLWAPQMQAEIRLVYVSPDHRGGRAFLLLMGAVEAWAKEKNCIEISFALASGLNDEKTAACLEKRGFKRIGIDMVKAPA